MVRSTLVRAVDTLGDKVAETTSTKSAFIRQLFDRWNSLDEEEKERVVSIVIATGAAAMAAVARARAKSPKKRAIAKAKKVVKRVVKR
jgi:hypothetical protein